MNCHKIHTAVNDTKKDKFKLIYNVSFFIFYINSMHPWFLIPLNNTTISLWFLIITILAYGKNYFNFGRNQVTILLSILLFVWTSKNANIFGLLEGLLNGCLFATVLSLKKDIVKNSISYVTKTLAIILLTSIIFYMLYQLGLPMPHSQIHMSESSITTALDNYYFFLMSPFGLESYRFYSIFREPGYLTLGVAPLLFLHKYNIKNKYVVIMLVAQLLSFSVAGYILLVGGYLYTFVCSSYKGKIKQLFSIVIVSCSLIMCVNNWFGDEFFQIKMLDRVEIVDGELSGNNRYSKYLESKYDEVMSSGDKWMGIDFTDNSGHGNSGYKLFGVLYGIIGLTLTILVYFSMIPYRKIGLNLITGMAIFCLVMLSQNSYPTATCVLIPMSWGRYLLINK